MIKKILKYSTVTIGSLLVFIVLLVILVWSYPEKILTSERVSGWVAPVVHFERTQSDAFPNAPLITLVIGKDGWKRRSLSVRLAPGCYSLAEAPSDGTEVCLETADLGVSLRLSRSTYFKLTGLDQLNLKVTRGRLVTAKSSPKIEEKATEPGQPFDFLKYLSNGFRWGPIRIDIERFDLPGSGLNLSGKISSAENAYRGKNRSPKLALDVKAVSPDWTIGVGGELFQQDEVLIVPNASVSYRGKKKGEEKPLALGGEISAKYDLNSGDLDALFAAVWKNPFTGVESLKIEDGTFRMRKEDLSARTTVKAQLQGKTPIGRIPVITADVAASMHAPEKSGARPIDIDLNIVAYTFAAIKANCDLSVTLTSSKAGTEIKHRKGELKIEAADLGKTITLLARTPWAIPVPFNVFRGPVVFHTEPFRTTTDRTTIPAVLTTELKSTEQAFVTETKAEIDIAEKDFGILGVKIEALLKQVQFRLPDYDPLAPVPALSRDSRIVRYEAPKPKPTTQAKEVKVPTAPFPLALSVKGAPGSIALLNRYFDPKLTAGVDLSTHAETGALKGSVSTSAPFDIHYLNRTIRMDRLEIALRPSLETTARVSMDRSGYQISANLHSYAGKTQITLGSEPPLNNDEIVSLLIYGMPKNSISSEQSRSVGSAQAAMGSEALGIFSFWAFASTPIESVLYDPETQTYSAVVKLPGGVTASIGSNWENDRQLALSKSIGRNWAVSTELIKDSDGVDRGGTLLRWRKSY